MISLIPAMDLLGGRVVRLHQGDYSQVTVYRDDPGAVLREFADAGATRVHVVDLDGARDGAATQAALIARIVGALRGALRVQVGGGIRDIDRVSAYLDAGVERVVLGTRAVESQAFVEEVAARCEVVVALDAREGRVATRGWTHTTEHRVEDLARRCAAAGARAVLYTDIARDGTGEGPNVDATEALAQAVPGVEVIASGGIGSLAHLRALAARPTIASAVIGRALYDARFTLREAFDAVKEPRP